MAPKSAEELRDRLLFLEMEHRCSIGRKRMVSEMRDIARKLSDIKLYRVDGTDGHASFIAFFSNKKGALDAVDRHKRTHPDMLMAVRRENLKTRLVPDLPDTYHLNCDSSMLRVFKNVDGPLPAQPKECISIMFRTLGGPQRLWVKPDFVTQEVEAMLEKHRAEQKGRFDYFISNEKGRGGPVIKNIKELDRMISTQLQNDLLNHPSS